MDGQARDDSNVHRRKKEENQIYYSGLLSTSMLSFTGIG